ncbi:MAG: hypothetical protein K8L99_19515 [Anaerolineae bacterium]|nr:hypothetical protein [Anaerolineae bacterium]
MLKNPWIRLLIGLVLVVIIGGALLILTNVPATTGVTVTQCLTASTGDECIRFPTVSGANLLEETWMLPDDFEGDYTLVVVPFNDAQQILAQAWLPLAETLAEQYPDMTYYNTAVFPGDIAGPVRVFIRAGMIMAVPDEALRAITFTLFLEDRDAFLAALDVPNTDEMQLFLLNANGEVLWQASGQYTEEKGAELTQKLADLHQ